MKKTYKYLLTIAFNGLLCLFVAFTANAQHNSNGGGGGGGSRPSGGGGGGGSRPSGGGGSFRPSSPSVSRPSSPSVSRPSGAFSRPGSSHVAVAPPRINSQGIRPAFTPGFRTGRPATYGVNPNLRNSVIGTRGYVGSGGRASIGAGGRGFASGGVSSWRSNGYYHYHHGYYGTYYAPRIGFSIGFLPYGYYPFYWNDDQYFYSGGLYYQYANNEYTVVEPPVGAEVTTLPSNAQSIMINGEQYYESDGVYYEPITKDDGTTSYQIAGKDGELNTNGAVNDAQQAAPQVGDIVQSLPPDCRKITLNGERYYVSADGYYYQDTVDPKNNKAYKIVGTPDDAPGN